MKFVTFIQISRTTTLAASLCVQPEKSWMYLDVRREFPHVPKANIREK